MPGLIPSRSCEVGRSARNDPVTVLYIDDTLSNLQVVKMILDCLRPHWRLLAALDGHSGLRQASEQRPDLILLNLQLPGMSGDAVLARLLARPPTSRVPVLLLSADASRQNFERLLMSGADDCLQKPFNVNMLVAKLDHLLQTSDENLLR